MDDAILLQSVEGLGHSRFVANGGEGLLREFNYALDRLIDGGHGRCTDCGEIIGAKRLVADPALSLCLVCQRNSDS